MENQVALETVKPSNFHPMIPAIVPPSLRAQADKFVQPPSVLSNNVGAGDSAHHLIQYTSVFMKSLRFKLQCTSRPDELPVVPGIVPGVTPEARPESPLPPLGHRLFRPMFCPIFVETPPRMERMYHMYAQAVPVPYMRTFGPSEWYKPQSHCGQIRYPSFP